MFSSGIYNNDNIDVYAALKLYIKSEKTVVSEWILNSLNKRNYSINKCGLNNLNKLEILELAASFGLKIPSSLVTNSKQEVSLFLKHHNRIITKAFSEGMVYLNRIKGIGNAIMYTEEITLNFINKLPKKFGLSFFQELLEKQFEIRIFVLDKEFFSMAIFSQSNTKTNIDFRKYDYINANRCVPFLLPKKIERKISKLLKCLNLQTASIDMVYTKNNNYVFLEINPVGQFGMVSKPCNYHLEEKMANLIIEKSKNIYEK